jgi:hypothetical protein
MRKCAVCRNAVWQDHPRAPLKHSNRLPNHKELDADHEAKLTPGAPESREPYVPPSDQENHRILRQMGLRSGSWNHERWLWADWL